MARPEKCYFALLRPTFVFFHADAPQAILEDLEGKLEAITEKLYKEGSDAATAAKIMKDKEAAEARVAKLYKEVGVGPPRSLWQGRTVRCLVCFGVVFGSQKYHRYT